MLEIRRPTSKHALSTSRVALLALLAPFIAVNSAHAHFKLLTPKSWLTEDASGGPQKGSPCGPGGSDNKMPIPESDEVTEYHAGETITVEWIDTIAHPGHFRIALAENRDDLVDPEIVQDGQCSYDESMVPTGAHGNVLADGIEFRSRTGFNAQAGHMFSAQVTLPDEPCDNCTLQVMQIMEADLQFISNCYYFHCANIKILPADGSEPDGGAGTDGSMAGAAGAAGTSETGGSAGAAGAMATGGSAGAAGTMAGAAGVGTGGAAGTGVAGTTAVMPTAGATGGTAGTGVVAGTGAPTAGTGVAGTAAPTSSSSGGCSVTSLNAARGHNSLFAMALLGLCFGFVARRSGARARQH